MSQLFGWEGALALSNSDCSGKFVSTQFPTFLTDSKRLDRQFLGWWMRQVSVWEALKGKAKGMGDRRRTLNPQALLSCSIPLPPLGEQRRIIAKIESLSAKIDEAKQLRQTILNDAQAMLRSAFQKIIKGAEYRPMAEVAPIVRRKVEIEMAGEYPELGVRSFHKGTFFKGASLGVDIAHKKMYHIEVGDLIFSNIMAWEGAIAVAKPKDKGRIGVHRFITCVPVDAVATSDFLNFYFQTGEGFQKIVEASPATIARNRTLSIKKLEKIDVPIPNYDKQLWFNRLQAQVAAIQQAQTNNQTELDALLPSILAKAFREEL